LDKIFDEIDQLSKIEKSNIMRYVENEDELVEGDCLFPFTNVEVI